ncbi:MAG: flagellar basal body-associated FliL family protein [Lachnospiraceae bacterium]|nr:flagellar basal body-associated FliL family protein [Lachnospiraceae bacterium]
MKKNILTVIILAATLVNLTLCGVMLFVYLPNAQKMNAMITKICQVIDLELESPIPKEKEEEVLPQDLEPILVAEEMTIQLTKGADGKVHHVRLNVSLVLNKKAEDYKTIQPLIEPQNARIKEIIQDSVGELTYENHLDSKELVKEEILKLLQEEFNTKCIYRIDFSSYLGI